MTEPPAKPVHRVTGVDHAAFPTFDPRATVSFYRDVLRFPLVHSISAAGWGPESHPDFVHFFFDVGNGDRLAFFYYFGLAPLGNHSAPGDAWARLPLPTPLFFRNSRHIALKVADEEDLLEYRRRLEASQWPVEMQVTHETIESIYVHDPNGYLIEITRPLRDLTPQEGLDAELTVAALCDVTAHNHPSMEGLLSRKAELIVEKAPAWDEERLLHATPPFRQ